ncbi:MAG: NAD-dependent epimerase/dehydratase family protein [Devosia sp.]|uniref:NAD-dependent epimerase/dehydratase family protein n=1 Tax=Devosia sp. TaxID=1871048 RepID=UPI001A3C34FC|nr:NAD-dependent epimerase/dehydratase family protein [Devosia sp.]MBL8598031.1 NAD-dependent epimerase/dehydratase family protein [Devosia sp.]
MTRTAFIIGGTGQIGIAAATELLRQDWNVTLAHTGRRAPQNVPADAGLVALDRKDTAALRSALGTGIDALIDTMAFRGTDADQLIGLRDLYGHLTVISSASVYEDDAGRSIETAGTLGLPVFEGPARETRRVVAPGPQSYSSAKVELEQRLLAASLPVALLRPCAIHGINSKHPREWWFVKRMLDGRAAIPLAGDADVRFHTSATGNIAALIAASIEHGGQLVLNAGDPDPLTLRQIAETLAGMLGWSGRLLPVPAEAAIGQTPFSVPHDFTVSMEAAQAIGYAPAATYAEALVPYLAWMKGNAADWQAAFPMFAHYPSDPFDYAAEDAA